MVTLIASLVLFLGLPLLLLFVFKSNAGIMFLAGCSGLVLLDSLDPAVVSTAGAIIPNEGEAYIRLAVVILTIVFASMLFRNSLKTSFLPLHILVIILLGSTLWLILPSTTGVSWLLENTKNSTWQDMKEFKTLFVASGISTSLLVVMLQQSKHSKRSKHSKH